MSIISIKSKKYFLLLKRLMEYQKLFKLTLKNYDFLYKNLLLLYINFLNLVRLLKI